MKPNELEIQNNLRVNYGERNHKVYRGNRPLLCGECIKKHNYPVKTKEEQFKTAKKGVQFIYENNRIICPECHREITILKDYNSWKKEQEEKKAQARENVQLLLYDKSWSSGIEYYRLSCKVLPEDWEKTKKYFTYYDYSLLDDEQDTMYGNKLNGWLTTQPEKVEEALGVKEENTLKYRNMKAKEAILERHIRHKRRTELKQAISTYFEHNGIKPGTISMDNIQGDVYEPEDYPWNIYGGGYRFIINDEECWFIRNNGADGDNWALNNVKTNGAGAIGWTVPYSVELEDMITEYCKL